MTFQVIHQPRGGARSPFYIVETQTGREVEWANRFLDRENARCLAETTLRAYAMDLLHFIRWWSSARQTDTVAEEAVASALPDYIRFQTGLQPRPAPATVNRRVIVAGCALRHAFPDAGGTPEPDFSRLFWLRSSLGCGRFRPARSRFAWTRPASRRPPASRRASAPPARAGSRCC